ncbi:MAG: hypothetical protein ABSH04_08240 [Acidimicrobiales bacterium]
MDTKDMQVVMTVSLTAALVFAAGALGVYIERKTIHKYLVPSHPSAAYIAARRRMLRFLIGYVGVLLVVGGITWGASGSVVAAGALVFGLMVVGQVTELIIRGEMYRRADRKRG